MTQDLERNRISVRKYAARKRAEKLEALEFHDEIQKNILWHYSTGLFAYKGPPAVPRNNLPILHKLRECLIRRRCSITVLGEISGVGENTIVGWFRDKSPNFHLLEACFNALGFNLEVTEMKNV